MKLTLTIVSLIFIGFAACTEGVKTNAETAAPAWNEAVETTAFLQVIDKETNSFFNGDYNGWSGTWMHAPYAIQAWNNDDGTYSAALGWDSINAQRKSWIEKYYANGKIYFILWLKKKKPWLSFSVILPPTLIGYSTMPIRTRSIFWLVGKPA